MAPGSQRARSLSLLEPNTASCRWKICPALMVPVFITAQLLLMRSYAAARQSLWSAVEIPRASLLYFSLRVHITCTYSSALLTVNQPARSLRCRGWSWRQCQTRCLGCRRRVDRDLVCPPTVERVTTPVCHCPRVDHAKRKTTVEFLREVFK